MYTINYILTLNGYFNINNIINDKIKVYSLDNKWITTNVFLQIQSTITIEFNNGTIITIPSHHKLYNEEMKLILASDLTNKNKIFNFKMPILQLNEKKNDNNYTNGYYLGWLNSNSNKNIQVVNDLIYIFLKDNNQIITSKLKIIGKYTKKENTIIAILKINNTNVPINSSIYNKIEWLSGLFDSIGYNFHKKYETRYIKLKINNRQFGNEIILLSNLLGLNPILDEIIISRKNKETGTKTNKYYEIVFKSDDINSLIYNYNLNYLILDYDKNEINMEPEQDPILSIKKITKQDEFTSYNITTDIDYIINGIVIHS